MLDKKQRGWGTSIGRERREEKNDNTQREEYKRKSESGKEKRKMKTGVDPQDESNVFGYPVSLLKGSLVLVPTVLP